LLDEDNDQLEKRQEEKAGGLDDEEKIQIKFFELVATLSFCNSS
jgi:hypothetical protein